jgi:copper chaperone
MATATLKVQGMTCGHCERTVTEVLEGAPGVRSAKVDLGAGRAVVEYDETRTNPRELAGLVMEEGYTAEEV